MRDLVMNRKKNLVLALFAATVLPLVGCASNEELVQQKEQYEMELEEQKVHYESEISEQQFKHEKQTERMKNALVRQAESLKHLKMELEHASHKQPKQYVVKKDDYLNKIAREHNMALNTLIHFNPQIKDVNTLFVGDVINLSQ